MNDTDNTSAARVLKDARDWIQLIRGLHEDEAIILITPAVTSATETQTSGEDPFEPLGRAIADRHAKIRHVPYIESGGLTSTHVGFIKRGHFIILCLLMRENEPINLSMVDTAFAVSDGRPCIIILCEMPSTTSKTDNRSTASTSQKRTLDDAKLNAVLDVFPAVLKIRRFAPETLYTVASALFGEGMTATSRGG